VDAALDAGAHLESLFHETGIEQALADRARSTGVDVLEVEPGGLGRVLSTRTPQPVAAVAPWNDVDLDSLVGPDTFLAVLLGVGDPGNAGTLVRSAAAAGASGVVFSRGSVDPYNPKCVRASAGALFATAIVRDLDPADVLGRLAGAGVRRVAAHPSAGTPHHDADLTGPVALLLGGEAAGLPDGALAEVDEVVTVPMVGPGESLNVAMAGTVLLFEAARQRADRRVAE